MSDHVLPPVTSSQMTPKAVTGALVRRLTGESRDSTTPRPSPSPPQAQPLDEAAPQATQLTRRVFLFDRAKRGRCGQCVSFEKSGGTCGLFALLNQKGAGQFELDEKVDPNANCTAFRSQQAPAMEGSQRCTLADLSRFSTDSAAQPTASVPPLPEAGPLDEDGVADWSAGDTLRRTAGPKKEGASLAAAALRKMGRR